MRNGLYGIYGLKMGLAAAALATSIGFTVHSCSSYSDAVDALNANPDYVESKTLDDVAGNLSSASSQLDYSPETVTLVPYEVCDAEDEEGDCISWTTHWNKDITPEDCPDSSDAKEYINNAISELEKTGAEVGPNPENAGLEGVLKELSRSLPDGNDLCYIGNNHVDGSTFENQRSMLESAENEVNAHSKAHDAKVPPGLKSDRNWGIFGIIASIIGILGSGAFGTYTVYRQKEDTGFYW